MIKFPTPPQSIDKEARIYLNNLVNSLTQFSTQVPVLNAAQPSVLLASPNGAVYTVAVTDAGTLTVTKVYGP